MPELTTTAEIRDLSPPGEILQEALEERGMSNAELARRTELSEKHVSQLVNGRVPLSMDVAFKLEQALGIPASFWLGLESNFRAEQMRSTQREQLCEFGDWMRRFPFREMVRCEYVPEVGQSVGPRVEALLAFFGVTSPDAWEKEWAHAKGRFRKSPTLEPDLHALTAWLRRGEVEGRAIDCRAFSTDRFREAIAGARKLTVVPPEEFVPRLVSLCAEAGVAFTLIPSLPKLAISGVTRWLGAEKAVISLSLRHKSDDQFWFSFFHEAYHVLEHKTSTIYIDAIGNPDEDPDERLANQFACDTLIAPDDYKRLSEEGPIHFNQVRSFAAKIGVSAGIVVGRMQHAGLLPYTHGNKLKARFRWKFES